jgi:hypothetical protein
MVNVNFLVIAYIVSLFVDWVIQWQWQAMNKSKWSKSDNKLLSCWAVTSHSFIYAILTTLITLYLIKDWSHVWLVFLVLFISHIVIDTRIVIKWIMRFKGMTWEQIYDYQNYGFMHIGIDHRLHEIVLLMLAICV